MPIEKKILLDKAKRREQIIEKISIVMIALLLLWIFISWLEVVYHNDQYLYHNTITNYSWWNLFNLLRR